MAVYPNLPAKIPGVLINCSLPNPSLQLTAPHPTKPVWSQLADEALANASLDDNNPGDILPLAAKVVIMDDNDDTPLTPAAKQTFNHIPIVEPPDQPTLLLANDPFPPLAPCQYPNRDCSALKHLGEYHMFDTVAEDKFTKYSYHNAVGHNVDIAITIEQMIAHVCHYVMLHTVKALYIGNLNNKKQYGLKASLRKFSTHGNTAVTKELSQLHTLQCFKLMDASKLSLQQRQNSLASLIFLTEKQTGKVKARYCANGSTQRTHIAKE